MLGGVLLTMRLERTFSASERKALNAAFSLTNLESFNHWSRYNILSKLRCIKVISRIIVAGETSIPFHSIEATGI
jgi:hypothetical protein